jgi:hypothetical protein
MAIDPSGAVDALTVVDVQLAEMVCTVPVSAVHAEVVHFWEDRVEAPLL